MHVFSWGCNELRGHRFVAWEISQNLRNCPAPPPQSSPCRRVTTGGAFPVCACVHTLALPTGHSLANTLTQTLNEAKACVLISNTADSQKNSLGVLLRSGGWYLILIYTLYATRLFTWNADTLGGGKRPYLLFLVVLAEFCGSWSWVCGQSVRWVSLIKGGLCVRKVTKPEVTCVHRKGLGSWRYRELIPQLSFRS